MSQPVRVALAGAGAFGLKHLDALRRIEGVRVQALVGRELGPTREVARRHGIAHASADLAEVLSREDVDAVLLCTPTPLHAAQALACLHAGKHVQIEIPLCDRLQDGQAVVRAQRASGRVAMCGHTRRFNPSHRWIRERIGSGRFTLQQLQVQTHFLRRSNMNALGQARTWTDDLLWHHAAHTVDLFTHQTGCPIVSAHATRGPLHPVLGIAMDMAVQLRAANGAICALSLSFNHDVPQGSTFRYIGDTGTYVARYDELVDGQGRVVDLGAALASMDGIERQDREFVAAVREGREPNASVRQVLPCYEWLHSLERQLLATPDAPCTDAPKSPSATLPS